MMKAEEYSERQVEMEPWQVKLTSYKLGDVYHCTADNVSPGAALARTTGASREERHAGRMPKITPLNIEIASAAKSTVRSGCMSSEIGKSMAGTN